MKIPTTSTVTELVPIHTSRNPALVAAMAAQEQWVTATSSIEALHAAAEKVPERNGLDLRNDVAADLLARLATGKAFPADLVDQLARINQVEHAQASTRALLSDLANQLSSDLDRALTDHVDDLLTHLAGQLDDVLPAAASALGDLAGAATADAAIAAGVPAAWTAWTKAVRTYTDVRDAQRLVARKLVGIEPGSSSVRYEDVALIRDMAAVFPHWPAWRRYGWTENEHGERQTLTPPWPGDDDPATYLEWLVKSDADPWVPTTAQYQDTHRHLAASLSSEPVRARPITTMTRDTGRTAFIPL